MEVSASARAGTRARRKNNAAILLRMSDDDYAAIAERAQAADVTMTAFLISAGLGRKLVTRSGMTQTDADAVVALTEACNALRWAARELERLADGACDQTGFLQTLDRVELKRIRLLERIDTIKEL